MSTDTTPAVPPAAASRGWLARILRRKGPVIPVVRLQGPIAASSRPGRINIQAVAPLLGQAFRMKKAPAVAIVVNSPGGSAVQSRLISKLIRDLADEYDKRVLVFIEDVAASGGYFIATGGDEIIADPSSIVGSIGVIYASFGFEEAIDRVGVKRRLYTAGRNKSTLDPFLPEKPEDVDRIKTMELDVHKVFIDHVKARRSGKLRAEDEDLFTGEFWSGVRGLDLGLVDALGDMHATLKERYGRDVRLKHVAPKRSLLSLPRLFSSQRLAGDMTTGILEAVEERALWSRFGL